MSSEVIIAPGPTIWLIRPASFDRSNSQASTDISSADVPPRLFNNTTCRPSGSRWSSFSTIAAIACAAPV